MINLEKNKQENSQRRPFKKTILSAKPYFHPFLKFFRFPPPGEVIKIYFPSLKYEI